MPFLFTSKVTELSIARRPQFDIVVILPFRRDTHLRHKLTSFLIFYGAIYGPPASI